jgi:hypothetical protein
MRSTMRSRFAVSAGTDVREYGIDGALAGLPAVTQLDAAHARFCPEWDEDPDALWVGYESVPLHSMVDDRAALGRLIAQ